MNSHLYFTYFMVLWPVFYSLLFTFILLILCFSTFTPLLYLLYVCFIFKYYFKFPYSLAYLLRILSTWPSLCVLALYPCLRPTQIVPLNCTLGRNLFQLSVLLVYLFCISNPNPYSLFLGGSYGGWALLLIHKTCY